ERIFIETTRPELLAACVALVAHPDDERYQPLFGSTVRTPAFDVEVPVVAHALADPEKGSGIAMICTFGDLTDVTWWRELQLPTRPIIGWDGRVIRETPAWIATPAAAAFYERIAGATAHTAKERMVEILGETGHIDGDPRPITHPVKFFEKGDKPLEIVTTRQWYITNGGREAELREKLLARGRELIWHPDHMKVRYENWVEGLNGDWLISRQRFFGVPLPLWYRLDADANPVYDGPLIPSDDRLPIDPSSDVPDGFTEDQRGQPGGFIGDPDVMDTWATSSLSPQIAGGWERDPDLWSRVYPMDVRPQAHEIIRTWLFSSVVRAHLEDDCLPWSNAAISGWILDPDRKKMSKSKGNVVTPMDLLDEYSSDAVRYWAASGRPGTDTAFDIAFEKYNYARALELAESFFWTFTDDYVELVKERAYGGQGEEAAASAKAALSLALSVQLRLFAPFLPFTTEEVWSWVNDSSIHRSSWPQVEEFSALPEGDPGVLEATGQALSGVRKVKSEQKVSMRARVSSATISGPGADIERIRQAMEDLAAAGSIEGMNVTDGSETLQVEAELAPVE
ncbi:MAG: valine--tRNA ligase, partial [Actinobacteria bacterium]|nr:valine--tRNA ligase [Actinomycetota bacterium]